MSNPVRENVPVLLVPSAWGVVGAVHVGMVTERTLMIAHVVMAVMLFLFAVTSWKEMESGVLRVWRAVLAVGFFVTSAGAFGLYGVPLSDVLLSVALYGWMLLPGVGLAYTARESDAPLAYAVGALLSFVGVVVYTAAFVFPELPHLELTAVALAGVGQTVGIADAVYRY